MVFMQRILVPARLALAVLLFAACAGLEEEIPVPAAPPPMLDGTLSPGEWDGAVTGRFADGSELLLMTADGALYLGICAVGEEMIAANVFVDLGGDVRILHISAALGTAIYGEDGDGWALVRDFEWCCRETTASDAAQTARTSLLEHEHWTSINSRVGNPNEIEVRIELPAVQHLAVNILRSSQPEVKVPWPAELNDDVLLPTPGGLPDVLQFTPQAWGLLHMEPGGQPQP